MALPGINQKMLIVLCLSDVFLSILTVFARKEQSAFPV